MPVYNETNNELYQSIKSVLNQTFTNFEFIIIDDNPKSVRICNFLHKMANNDKRIRLLFNSISVGPSISANKAIKHSHNGVIARMDADDICNKNRLELQLKFMLDHNLDFVCSNFCGFTDNIKRLDLPYYGNINKFNQNQIKKIFSISNIAIGPTLFFRKGPFFNIGGYRNILSEDYDLAVRYLIYKYRVGYQSSVILYKRNRQYNLSNNNALSEFIYNDIISKYVKHMKYSRELEIDDFYKATNIISKKDMKYFRKFQQNFNTFKETKSVMPLFRAILDTISSDLVFKRNIWILFINKINRRRA